MNVHGGIRHLETQKVSGEVIGYVHGGIRHLENMNNMFYLS